MRYVLSIIGLLALIASLGSAQAGGQCRNESSGPECPCDNATFARNHQGNCVPSTRGKKAAAHAEPKHKAKPKPKSKLQQCKDNFENDYNKNIRSCAISHPYDSGAAGCKKHYKDEMVAGKKSCDEEFGPTPVATPRRTRQPTATAPSTPSPSPSPSPTPLPGDWGTCKFPGAGPDPMIWQDCLAKCGGTLIGCGFEPRPR